MGDTITVEAQLKNAISPGMKSIAEDLKAVSTAARSSSSETSSALKHMEGAATGEAKAVNESKKAHEEAGKAAEEHGSKLGGLKEHVLGLGDAILAFATGGLAVGGVSSAFDYLSEQIKDTVKAGMQAQQTEAGLEATLRATGKTTGVTAEQASALAESFSKVTTYSADTILSGESMLATFTNIGKKVFPDATKETIELASKLGISLPSAARLVGRALQDPAKGMTLLTRYGITLSETQKQQIAHFMKINDVADAQGIVLGALKGRFGDVAEAMGNTLAGKMQILQNQFELTKEKVGEAMIPVLTQLENIAIKLSPLLTDILGGALEVVGNVLSNFVVPAIGGLITFITQVEDGVQKFAGLLGAQLKPELDAIGQMFGDMGSSVHVVADIVSGNMTPSFKGLLPPMTDIAQTLGQKLAPVLMDVARQVYLAYGQFENFAEDSSTHVLPILAKLQPAIGIVGSTFQGIFNTALQVAIPLAQQVGTVITSQVWPAFINLLPTLGNVANTILTVLVPAAGTIIQDLLKLYGVIESVMIPIIGILVSSALKVLGDALNAIIPIVNKLTPIIVELAGFLGNALGNAFKFLQPYITAAAKSIGQFADDIVQHVAPILNELADIIVHLLNDVIVPIWNAVWPALSFILKNVFNNIVGTIQIAWSVVTGLFNIITDLLAGHWSQVWVDFKNMLGGIWSGIQRIFQSTFGILLGLIGAAWNNIWNMTSNSFNSIKSFLGNIWSGIQGVFTGELHIIQSTLSNTWSSIWGGVTSVWNNISSFIGNTIHNVWTTIENIAGKIEGSLLSPFQGARNAITQIMKDFGNFGLRILNGDLNALAGFANGFGGAINFVAGKLGHANLIPHITAPQVAYLAKGTDSFDGGVAVVGEEGPELVTLPKGTKVMPANQTKATLAALHGSIPAFAGGIGDVLGDIVGWFTKGASALVSTALSAAHVNFSLPGALGGLAAGAFGGLKNIAISDIQKWLSVMQTSMVGGGVGGTASGLLRGFPQFNQLSLTDVNRDFDCVPTALAAGATYLLGHLLSPVQLKDAVYGAGYRGGTSPGRFAPYLRSHGVGLGSVGGNGTTIVDAAINNIKRGVPTAVSIPSNWNNAASQAPTHEVIFAGYDAHANTLTAMNPWRGFWQTANPTWWMPRIRYGYGNPMTRLATGGLIPEPVMGIGLHSGNQYSLGERGPEYVTPASSRGTISNDQIVVNIYLDGTKITDRVANGIVARVRTVNQMKV